MIDPVLIEELADRAWPAAERVALGPWWARTNQGVTRRANSVFTAGRRDIAGDELQQWVDAAERFYAGRSLPAIFQISGATGATGLDALLEARGYRIDGASEVWVSRPTLVDPEPDVRIEHAEDPSEAWLTLVFDEPEERKRVHAAIAGRAPRPRVFLSLTIDGELAACAMGVSAGGYTGLFGMVTRPAFRRRGLGLRMVREVGAWAKGRGDAGVYLQVMRDNDAAKGLYRRAGFERAYGYHYRVR